MEKEHVKNRQATEQLLLEAVNRLVEQDGFEGLGINAVAAQAGVSKMLIYRYFGSLNGLIAAYIRRYDFWINVRPELPGRERLGDFIKELFRQDGVDLSTNHNDCGLMIFDLENQDVHCGGSGCGCSASVLTGYLLNGMREGRWKNILFCPTGALHSPTSAFQGESVPGICHAIAISAVK